MPFYTHGTVVKKNVLKITFVPFFGTDSCADSCSYLAICARDLFRLELAPLLGQLVQKCSNDSTAQQQQQQQAQSVVQQLLMFADARVRLL
jgi:hypothetical protein